MEKVLGIICEYNPFHNGHLYHLEQSKKITGSNYVVAIMSGNFTQRGDPAIIDKWSRAEMALKCGVDLVLELPALYSTSSAENFAYGAVRILDSLKIIDYICFGSETSNLETLSKVSDVLYKEPKKYKTILSDELDKGISFPKARENALLKYLNNPKKYTNILSSPNNILGVEYIKSLKKLKSKISPIVIERSESRHNDLDYSGNIASATAIRNIIKNGDFDIVKKLLPKESYSILVNNIKQGHFISDLSVFEKQIIYNLRKMDISQIAELPDVTEGLEFSIKKTANSCNTIQELQSLLKSKRYTATRLQRILLYSLLEITKKDIILSRKTSPYARVLALNDKGKYMISEIAKSNPNLEIITSVKRFLDKSNNKNIKFMIDKDIFSTNVYSIGYNFDSYGNLDFIKKIVTI